MLWIIIAMTYWSYKCVKQIINVAHDALVESVIYLREPVL